MPLFSEKQIIHAHFLLTEHGMDVNQLAQELGTTIRNAHRLIRLVWQKYEKPKQIGEKKYCYDSKPVDVLKDTKPPFVRPKAEYSNKRLYDLI